MPSWTVSTGNSLNALGQQTRANVGPVSRSRAGAFTANAAAWICAWKDQRSDPDPRAGATDKRYQITSHEVAFGNLQRRSNMLQPAVVRRQHIACYLLWLH